MNEDIEFIKEVDRALDAIEYIANSNNGTWQERKEAVLEGAKAMDSLSTLEEFTSWFDAGDF